MLNYLLVSFSVVWKLVSGPSFWLCPCFVIFFMCHTSSVCLLFSPGAKTLQLEVFLSNTLKSFLFDFSMKLYIVLNLSNQDSGYGSCYGCINIINIITICRAGVTLGVLVYCCLYNVQILFDLDSTENGIKSFKINIRPPIHHHHHPSIHPFIHPLCGHYIWTFDIKL